MHYIRAILTLARERFRELHKCVMKKSVTRCLVIQNIYSYVDFLIKKFRPCGWYLAPICHRFYELQLSTGRKSHLHTFVKKKKKSYEWSSGYSHLCHGTDANKKICSNLNCSYALIYVQWLIEFHFLIVKAFLHALFFYVE